MNHTHNYTSKELETYAVSSVTLGVKESLASQGIEFLIEGLDQKRIDLLKSHGQFNKETYKGQLRDGDISGIANNIFSNPRQNNYSYLPFEDAVHNADANVVVTRTSGLKGNEKYSFFLQGDLYSIPVNLIEKGE